MSRFQPALLGGLFIGVLSSLPIVSTANLCCCLWVVVGGLLTVYLQQQKLANPVESSEAALGGLVAGVIGAAISLVISAVMLSFVAAGSGLEDRLRDVLEQNPQVPSDVRDIVVNAVSSPFFLLMVSAVTLPVYAVFGMLGGLLGLAIFRKKTPPPAPPPPDAAGPGLPI
jgi:hypothetical protein